MKAMAVRDKPNNLLTGLGLAFLVLAGLCYRLHYLYLSDFRPDSDEAVVGLMAKHILEGQEIPVFYYGQHYMGSLEAILTAAVFAVTGITVPALKIVPLIFSLILIVLMYYLGTSLKSSRSGWIAAALTAIPPGMLVIWSTKTRGGFIELVVIGVLSLLLFLQWMKQKQLSRLQIGLVGMILGIGWWVNNQIVYFMLVIGFLAIARVLQLKKPLGKLVRYALSGLIGFLIGGLPYWIYNLQNKFISFEILHHAGEGDLLSHFEGLFTLAYPILLGARRPWSSQDVFPLSTLLVTLVYGGLIIWWIFNRRYAIAGLFKFSVDSRNPQELALLLILACSGVFVMSSFGQLAMEPRYLLPIYVGFFLVAAFGIDYLFTRSPRSAGIVLLAVLLIHLASLYWNGLQMPGEPVVINRNRVARDHDELIKWLNEQQISWVRTDYWIGHRLAFETEEKVKFISFGEHRQCRIPEYCEFRKNKEAIRFMPLILVSDQAKVVRTALKEQGYYFKMIRRSGYVIVYDIREEADQLRPVPLKEVEASASHNTDALAGAFDGDLSTRWGSGERQEPGMWVTFTLPRPVTVRAVRYNLGNWPQDFPRGLEMEIETATGERLPVFNPHAYNHIRYLLMGDSVFRFFIEPTEVRKVYLRQTGSHPVFDWSIAELELLS